MRNSILILEPACLDLSDLEQAFRLETGDAWDVQRVASDDQLIDALADKTHNRIAVVPHGGDGDVNRPLPFISRIHQAAPDAPIIVVAEAGDVAAARQAIDCGATDFLVLGQRLRERIATLMGKLSRLLKVIDRNRRLDEHNARLREKLQARFEIVGRSPQIKSLLDQISRVASIPRPVLIVGQRGTGKESVARAIHYAAGDDARPLVTVNCAAFNDSILESELFGHQRGAFTGADKTQRGKFEQADGGTLFLDEVGNMSLPFQQKILRVVEYGVFSRVGGNEEIKTTARVIAATNCDLREKIEQGEFLPDLYDRLAFETLEVPPLRARKSDIELLARYFLDRFAVEKPAFAGKQFSPAAVSVLKKYSFPGNIRELKNIVERAAYRDTTDEITPQDLGLPIANELTQTSGTFQDKVDAFSRHLIDDALGSAGGNQAEAARRLGLSYHQFRYYYKKYR